MISILLIALSLSVDACAASVCCGVAAPGFRSRDALRLGLWFGGFQAGMTLLGSVAGRALSDHVQRLGGLIAFGLLAWLGGRMIWNAFAPEAGNQSCDLHTSALASLAVATSLDALAVGVSLVWLDVSVLWAAAIIGAVSFAMSAAGGLLGTRIGGRFHRWAGFAGGVVLIGIGVKILMGG